MARKRKAVESGSTGKQPKTTRSTRSADVAGFDDAGASGSAMSTNTKPKRNARRTAKDRWEEEKLMTSTTSQLIDKDLVKLLARPEAWDCLEESEKEEILSLLPESLHPNRESTSDDPETKIPPLPESFLRYSNFWRDSIRLFQLDLQHGRYDPEWQRQAHEAVRERAKGKFDRFKEEEFEEFWGQKQKMDKTLAAGQSSQVKLTTLIEHGVVREGDVWKYTRTFAGKGRNKVLVEKEAKILKINGKRLNFVIPSGQRVFLSAVQAPVRQHSTASSQPKEDEISKTEIPTNGAAKENEEAQGDTDSIRKSSRSRKRKSEVEHSSRKKRQQESISSEEDSQNCEPDDDVVLVANPKSLAVEVANPQAEADSFIPTGTLDAVSTNNTEAESVAAAATEALQDTVGSGLAKDEESSSTNLAGDSDQTSEIILDNIGGPSALALKILEVDGRIKDVPNGNAWKEFRSYRNNQDMGSLWEVRQAWYLRGK
ncbi:hypothetical protein IFM53868_04437 [Aspergillus udagawae]|uniref:DEUBAD domain-containing protein n=1 Tax=Aspergillus udagawae TaxID=91492 RepID=A0A8H3S1W9_9EURO|nr:hypothetical protein IFM46972_06127 [Aspergillus udagawae]GFF85302.1 hypothetical protein IFM53868_04437 [Aspergillus udagawae]GFG02631.1 hypothetical protein IFM5058_01027 [Aspergillus udagawae]